MSLVRGPAVRGFLGALTLLVLLVGATTSWADSKPLKLGLWPYHSPRYLVNYYEDLRQHLEARVGRPVQLETSPSVELFMQRTVRREYDVALIAAHLGRLVQTDHGWKPLAGYKEKNAVYIITRQEMDIHDPVDLKGKTIATQDRGMLMSLSAKKWLKSKGVAEDEFQWLETGGLATSVYSVVSGQADAGVATLASLSMSSQSELDQLRIVGNAGIIPQLYLIASPSLNVSEVKVLRLACLDFIQDGKNVLTTISDKELRSLDEFAAQGRSLLNNKPLVPQ